MENGTYKQSQEQNEAVAGDGIADEVMILVEKKAGEEKYRLKIEASRAAAAMNGIALLVVEYANSIGVSVESAVAVLATVLLAPDKKEA